MFLGNPENIHDPKNPGTNCFGGLGRNQERVEVVLIFFGGLKFDQNGPIKWDFYKVGPKTSYKLGVAPSQDASDH